MWTDRAQMIGLAVELERFLTGVGEDESLMPAVRGAGRLTVPLANLIWSHFGGTSAAGDRVGEEQRNGRSGAKADVEPRPAGAEAVRRAVCRNRTAAGRRLR